MLLHLLLLLLSQLRLQLPEQGAMLLVLLLQTKG
jgi:hypothetical protein